jgi:hypothetical protein
VGGKIIGTRLERNKKQTTVFLAEPVQLREGEQLEIAIVSEAG